MRYEALVSALEERLNVHTARLTTLQAERARLDSKETRLSFLRLGLFLLAAATTFAGATRGPAWVLILGLVLGFAFFAAVVLHAKVLAHRRAVDIRIAIHQRHQKRIRCEPLLEANDGRAHLDPSHPYAGDLDLVGPGSLFQRIDVTQTLAGEASLANALGAPASAELIYARQAAVKEIAADAMFREDLELHGALHQQRGQKLDYRPFMSLFARQHVYAARPWLKPVVFGLLLCTLTTGVLSQLGLIASQFFWMCIAAQGFLLWSLKEQTHGTLDLISARVGFAQAYEGMLRLIEDHGFSSPHWQSLRRGLEVQGQKPSLHMQRLTRYEGFAQFRTQGPVYLVINLLTMWDLLCLERIERFADDVGPHCEAWFKTVAEIELLASLATLLHVDVDTSFPVLVDEEQGLTAEGLLHPLLPSDVRVGNDLGTLLPKAAVIVTGSNMAGKSTLLRALGLNVALALAGGPVCARSFSLPRVRLRASMRIEDSLQRGASYFHAELSRLRMVVADLEQKPPVLFLLDEILRGTNARARHQGARAVLLHLISRGAMGLVATHDIALSELEAELPGRIRNIHFTDVFEDNEMRFDFKLRQGVVRTSNALRLLAMAGVDVEVDDLVG